MPQILVLNIAGVPTKWVSPADAAHSYVTGRVVWDLGDQGIVLRGGRSRMGVDSVLTVKPVIAIGGPRSRVSGNLIPLSLGRDNTELWRRDRYTCAYCGGVFAPADLSRDHILAQCRGGRDTWMNCVTACKICNQAKGSKLVEDFRPLLFAPYVPCANEKMILSGRGILIDQMDYLAARLPKHSRIVH